ncbi:helix-turn-helix domain-containing protein [Puteibacter caeruleilacunae]|nr:helix-turn-helix domain-containing protein [Puteibacter caeruleilacunae]
MKAILALCVFIIFSFCAEVVKSQSLRFESVTAQDGLFSNRFFKTYRDNEGYLWIAGINGVAKYDGVHVTNYTEKADTNNYFIRGVRFYDIVQDKSNNIWIAGDSGIHKFDVTRNTFVQVGRNKIIDANFIHFLSDSTMEVLCDTKENYLVNTKSHTVRKLPEKGMVSAVVKDDAGKEWKGMSNGLVIYDDSDTIINLKIAIRDICLTPNRHLCIGTTRGLVVVPHLELDKEKKDLVWITEFGHTHRLTNNIVTAIEYLKGSVWVGTREGLNQIHLSENGTVEEIQHHYNLPNDPYSLQNNQINDITADNEGILWIATYGGLNKLDPQHQWFYSLKNDPESVNSLHANNIFQIEGNANGNIWFGSFEKGASRLNPIHNHFIRFDKNTDTPIRNVRCITTDSHGDEWITADNKLFLVEKEGLVEAAICDLKKHKYKRPNLTAIIQHPNGNYWMGVNGKIVEFQRAPGNTFNAVRELGSKLTVVSFYIDNYNRIWAGTNNAGVVLVKPGSNLDSASGLESGSESNISPGIKTEIYQFNKTSHPILKADLISVINHDSEGNLWLGSSDGLYRVSKDSLFEHSPEKTKFKAFFEKDGLTNNYVTGILPDKNGVLWLSSWKGIMKYDPTGTDLCQFTPYSFSDGLSDEKYNRCSMYREPKTNTYYFGSANGVTYFNPIKENENQTVPRVLLNQVELNGDLVALNHNLSDSSIVSKVEYNGVIDQLLVKFGSSSLLSPTKQVFAWKLEGRDEEWTYSRKRQLLIKDIPPGKYTLKISAASRNKLGKAVLIEITVNSYLTRILMASSILILIIGLGFWIRRRKKIIEEVSKKENKYLYSKLTEDKFANIAKRLTEIMESEKPYLQTDLTADKLAKMVDVSPGELSQLLNEYLNTKFYEYVNRYRIEEFIGLLSTPQAEKHKITALAEQCGFSSTSTFYRAFNNEKGMTPAQYAKNLNKK